MRLPARRRHQIWERTRGLPSWLTAVYYPLSPPAYAGPVLTVLVSVGMTGRGIDFLTGPTSSAVGEAFAYVRAGAGVTLWGWLFLTSGVALVTALLSRGLALLILAHLFAAATYAGFLASVTQGVIIAHGDGIRFVTSALVGFGVTILRLINLRDNVRAAASGHVSQDRRRPHR